MKNYDKPQPKYVEPINAMPDSFVPIPAKVRKKRIRQVSKYEKVLKRCRVGDSFAVHTTTRQAIYIVIKRLKKDGIIFNGMKFKLTPDPEGVGTFRVYRVR